MPGMRGTMKEFEAGTLHSGSKTGHIVTNPKQAIAIGLSEERAAGAKIPLPTRNKMSPSKRAMRDRSTKGSPPFEHAEFSCGYRKL